MISVAISSYNGKKYIIQQLQSILSQTLLPDEIVIIDDCSTDDTYEKIQSFANSHSEVSWNISKNEMNLGWMVNFKKCLLRTRGDIIFIADQDDYWFNNKIELMANAIESEPSIVVLGAEFEVLHSTNISVPQMPMNEVNPILVKQKFDNFYYMITCPGCNLAIRREALRWFELSIWDEKTPHDELLWIVGKINESAYILSIKTMFYCRYEEAETYKAKCGRSDRLTFLNNKINTSQKYYNALSSMKNSSELNLKLVIIRNVTDFLVTESRYIQNHKFSDFLYLMQHIDMYQHKSRLIGDFFYSRSNR